MTAFDPVRALEDYHAAIERRDWDAIERSFAHDARYVSAGVGALEGRAAILAAFRRYFAEFSDQVARDGSVLALSPRSARAAWNLTATSLRTGNRVERRGEEIVTFGEDGRIASVEVLDE